VANKSREERDMKYGRLTVISEPFYTPTNSHAKVLCECECGKQTAVFVYNLKNGHTFSCGCLNIEKLSERFTKHGYVGTPTYNTWRTMKERCTNPSNKIYSNRGISVCDRWKKFKFFLADMGERPAGCQLDRIDNNGNYEPINCRWVTPKEQQRNRRNNILWAHNGKTQCMAQWEEETGISIKTLWDRVYKHGWTIDKALTQPIRRLIV
jgi:hypothetical protein